ncbi:MAG: TetR/AcrR family transcriptional regulator C-terminal domain-containing protein [Microbacterium sp.]
MKGITREGIVQAALDVLDADGIDAVTVRAVAARLDVKAPALYHHVHGKQELLDEMGTEIQRRVNAAFQASGALLEWPEAIGAYARALRTEYLKHRDGARTFSGTRLTDPAVLRAQEPWLQRGVDAGWPLGMLLDAAECVAAFVVGFVIEEQERMQSAGEDRYSVAERDAALGEGVPLVVASGHDRGDGDTRFARQLQLLLTGIRAGVEPAGSSDAPMGCQAVRSHWR